MESADYLIVAIENPLLDIQLDIETDDLLKKYALQHGQACLADATHQPLFGELWANESKIIEIGKVRSRPRGKLRLSDPSAGFTPATAGPGLPRGRQPRPAPSPHRTTTPPAWGVGRGTRAGLRGSACAREVRRCAYMPGGPAARGPALWPR